MDALEQCLKKLGLLKKGRKEYGVKVPQRQLILNPQSQHQLMKNFIERNKIMPAATLNHLARLQLLPDIVKEQ